MLFLPINMQDPVDNTAIYASLGSLSDTSLHFGIPFFMFLDDLYKNDMEKFLHVLIGHTSDLSNTFQT